MRFKIGRAAGIDIFMHWTFVFAPMYLIYDLRISNGWPWSAVGLFLVLLFATFACVLLHEYGHALAARCFGVRTRDIIMTPIGGIARLERMPRSPKQELLITLAGPLVNLVIGGLLCIVLWLTQRSLLPNDQVVSYSEFPAVLMWMNFFLFAFNLIPAFPMDGGRILRSLLALTLSYQTATTIASVVGQLLAVALCVTAIVTKQYSLLLIGGFVIVSARFELAAARRQLPSSSLKLPEQPPSIVS